MKRIIFCALLLLLFSTSLLMGESFAEAERIMASAYVEGGTKDTWNLRADADFSLEVYNGVWWVPASILGQSRYTNQQIASIVSVSPFIKKNIIGNLYEAIQLFQIGDFSSDDYSDSMNVRVKDSVNGYNWEKHCPGYYAVEINRGNCSTTANWLNYLIEDDYEEWGTLNFQYADGNGHAVNYIYSEGYYYFIDMTHYRNDFFVLNYALEDGRLSTYRRRVFSIFSYIHKAESPLSYVEYCILQLKEKPVFFYMIKCRETPDLTVDSSITPLHMVIDSSVSENLTVVYIDEKKMTYGFYLNSSEDVNWKEKSRHKFSTRITF